MALFVSVLGLSGLAAFALLGFTMELAKIITKSMRTPAVFCATPVRLEIRALIISKAKIR